ncbi:MAG: hypothetical protein ACK4TF_01435 [Thermodesulfovibrionales bacterium]
MDFVEHNGGNSTAISAITGIYTDLYSQWTVRAAGLGKNLQSIYLRFLKRKGLNVFLLF